MDDHLGVLKYFKQESLWARDMYDVHVCRGTWLVAGLTARFLRNASQAAGAGLADADAQLAEKSGSWTQEQRTEKQGKVFKRLKQAR